MVEGEIVVLDLEQSMYLAANRTGALLWQALAAGTTRGALIALLAGQFQLSTDVAAADVDRFLVQISEYGLLRR